MWSEPHDPEPPPIDATLVAALIARPHPHPELSRFVPGGLDDLHLRLGDAITETRGRPNPPRPRGPWPTIRLSNDPGGAHVR